MAQVMMIKTSDRVYVATTSINGYNIENNGHENNRLQWTPSNCNNTILAAPASFNALPILKTTSGLIDEDGFGDGKGVTKRYLMQRFVPHLIHELQDTGYIKKGKVDNLNMNMVIATRNKSFFVGYNGNIRVLPDVCSYPISDPYFVSCLEELEDVSNVDYRMLIALYYASLSELNIDYPIVINDTLTMEPRIYYAEDVLNIVKQYEKGELN